MVKPVVSFDAYRQDLMGRKLYKSITIVRGKPNAKFKHGEWYVQYYYSDPLNPSIFKPVRTRGGLNRIHDLEEREKEAQLLKRDVKRWLERGNIPAFSLKKVLANDIDNTEVDIKDKDDITWSLQTAITEFRKFIKLHGYAPRTIETYKQYVDDLEEWLKDAGMLERKAYEFTEFDALPLLDDAAAQNDWSGRTYNNNLEFLGNFFNRCKKLEKQKTKNRNLKYEFNIEDIDPKLTNPQVNKAYSPQLAAKIKYELDQTGNELLRDYVAWIVLSLMRPKEIRNLKIDDIDIESRQIRIVGKSGDRLIPINDSLMKLIIKKDLVNKDVNMYVFGKALKTSSDRMGTDFPLQQYAVISEKLKLDKVYKIYSWKPYGVIRLINAGFSDREIMMQTGHKTVSAFEKYKRDLVIDNKHVMKGKTIDF